MNFFGRGIDDVRTFGSALTDGEIRRIHDDVGAPTFSMWRFEDGTAKDYSWRNNHGTLSGGTSVIDGVSGKSLQLNGVDGAAVADHFGVTMRDSFTVSAWARLQNAGKNATVVAQDGSRMSGFALQYRADSKRWVFGAHAEDADASPLAYVGSLQPAQLDRWVHLSGVYDYSARQLRLYVDGKPQGARNNVSLWTTFGKMTMGRGKLNGAAADFFPGAIDEIYTFQGVVSDAELLRKGTWAAPPANQLGRLLDNAGDHATRGTSTGLPDGYHFEGTLGMLPAGSQPNLRTLYACMYGKDAFTSPQANCENQVTLGEAGRVFAAKPTNIPAIAVYRCNTGTDHFESRREDCEGATHKEGILGYTIAYAPLARYTILHAHHWVASTAPVRATNPRGTTATSR